MSRFVSLDRVDNCQFGLRLMAINGTMGARVVKVHPDQKADIQINDCIMSVANTNMLTHELDNITATLERTVTARLEVRQYLRTIETFLWPFVDGQYGIAMASDKPYLEICGFHPSFPNSILNIHDVIVMVNDQPVTNVREFQQASGQKTCKLLVFRFGDSAAIPPVMIHIAEPIEHEPTEYVKFRLPGNAAVIEPVAVTVAVAEPVVTNETVVLTVTEPSAESETVAETEPVVTNETVVVTVAVTEPGAESETVAETESIITEPVVTSLTETVADSVTDSVTGSMVADADLTSMTISELFALKASMDTDARLYVATPALLDAQRMVDDKIAARLAADESTCVVM